jgi:two-component system phosphate regulon response regulator PhoB
MNATVLVVEDDPAMQRLLASVLQDSAIEPVLLSNAEDALRRLPQDLPNLILCDLNLPGMNGAAFIEALRASDLAKTPVILMSAHDEPPQHSANLFVSKPFDPFVVVDLVEEMIRNGQQVRDTQAPQADPLSAAS